MANDRMVGAALHLKLRFVLIWLCALSVSAAALPPSAPARAVPTRPGGASTSAGVGRDRSEQTVLLGIDVLEASGFSAVKGKRLGLLTHAAGVNRLGVRTIDVLHRAPGVNLVALFAVEHGISGAQDAEEPFGDSRDPRSGLPVLSLYSGHGKKFRPTAAQLRRIDALVIDLQDIGVRSYTYSGAMKTAMEACFASGKEVIVLDRPNPLGGLKVDGPILDEELMSDVGRFCVPYVHGLTIGELARMAVSTPAPAGLALSKSARSRAKLTVIPMRGWHRSMRWPDTGLRFIPPSQKIGDFGTVVGYAMVGLGCEYSGFVHGLDGANYFRVISFRGGDNDRLERDLKLLRVPGLNFRTVQGSDKNGRRQRAVMVDVVDWQSWNPTELSFELMRLACRYNPSNPFRSLSGAQRRSFNIHVGSAEWLDALRHDGANVKLEAFERVWREQARAYQQRSRRFWLYD
jgi:uncharacterized protein YbbC (DUF1343 family)